jgi:hypothetical protein
MNHSTAATINFVFFIIIFFRTSLQTEIDNEVTHNVDDDNSNNESNDNDNNINNKD